jgi:hypothetical protein
MKFGAKPDRIAQLADPYSLPTWDDVNVMIDPETEAPEDGTFEAEARDLAVVCHIVSGIMSLQKPAHHQVQLVAHELYVTVWEDLKATFANPGPDQDRFRLIVERTAKWWKWALEGDTRPTPPLTFAPG